MSSEQASLLSVRQTDADLRTIYLASIALANSGASLPQEAQLPETERALLQVRRCHYQQNFSEAKRLLHQTQTDDLFLKGDWLFLRGQYHHRLGEQNLAAQFMSEAADLYRQVGEGHRELRARVNGAICLSSLESCMLGELHVLLQEARRLGHNDICANILRTKAMELLIAARPREAMMQAIEAASFYHLDGYREDQCVALMVAAICAVLIGDFKRAQELRDQVLIEGGKVQVYNDIYEGLCSGRMPKVAEGHALGKVQWKSMILRPNSISGKIVLGLRARAMTRDELITHVWGDLATNQSYCDRLYTAINSLRKERNITVMFDGEYYRL